MVVPVNSFRTLKVSSWVDLLRERATEAPERTLYRFLAEGSGGEPESGDLGYAALEARARALGAVLQGYGAQGERVLLVMAPGEDYVVGFFGCLMAGAVAVPAYPPPRNRPPERLLAILGSCGARTILTTRRLAGRLAVSGEDVAVVAADEVDPRQADTWRDPGSGAETVAFLQYTSGSTGTPKGVVLTHGNLAANSEAIRRTFETGPESRGVSWLPPYHDMGLIGAILQPLYSGFPMALMTPASFLQRPRRWLEAISRERATVSGGPDFAFDLCVRRIPPEQRVGLDLSHWRVAFNGAEPVRAATLERFAEAFASVGFRREAFQPCYGLAESTLLVAGERRSSQPTVRSFDAAALENHRALPATDAGSRSLVSSGRPAPGQEVTVVDPESRRPVEAGRIGEIWISGASVARGYWEAPAETEAAFGAVLAETGEGPYLRTGDLGFVDGGELFVTGRLKDLIILRGKNLYPQDVEATAEASHAELRPGCGAAFSVDTGSEEQLVIVHEVARRARAEPEEIAQAIREKVIEEHEVPLHEVVLIRTATIPKTSSGKIRRRHCRKLYLAGGLDVVASHRREVAERAWVAPETDVEIALAEIWREVCGVERPGVHDDFFELGGHSLLVTQALSRVRERFEVDVSFADFFADPTIAGLAARIEAVRVDAAGSPEASLTALDRHRLLVEWAADDDGAPRPPLRFLHQVFEALTVRNPEAVAVADAGGYRSFNSLDLEANRIAQELRGLGVGPETLVGLCLDRTWQLAAGLLGVLKAGGGCVPLDPTYPRERLAFMLGDARAAVVLTCEPYVELLGETEAAVLLLDGPRGENHKAPAWRGHTEQVAYVVYTSGSTGRPKGVVVSHGHFLPLVAWSRERFGLGPGTRVYQNLSPCFDFGLFEILTTLTSGGLLRFPEREELVDLERFGEGVRRYAVNTLHSTPSIFRQMVARGGRLESLEVVHLGGETITQATIDEVFAAVGPAGRLWNGYGPTEATVNSAIFPLARRHRHLVAGHASLPIGRVTAGNRAWVLDRAGSPVAVGGEGELCLGGRRVTRGYLRRPGLTAEKFVPEPWTGEPGARLYRSGDLVRYHGDGQLEFLGRIDHQVKVRGFRIELGEIESVLEEHPGVAEAVVLAREDVPGARRLVAYVRGTDSRPDGRELRAFLTDRLPEYMVPSAWVAMAAFPLGPSGKTDRKALPPPGRAGEAGLVEVVGRTSSVREAPPIERAPRDAPLPLSFAQERLWIMDRLAPGNPVYNLFQALRLRGGVEVAALEASFAEIVRRHESLRTTFDAPDGRPVQVVAEAADLTVPVVDLAGLTGTRGEAAVLAAACREARRGFDLTRGPLLRVTLLELGLEEHVLLVTMHHVISDNWSMGVLGREVSALYPAALRRRPSPLAPLRLQYADFAVWQRRWLAQNHLERELAWWRNHLAGELPVLDLPTDRPRPPRQSFRGAVEPFTVGPESLEALRSLSRQEGGTLFFTLLAAFAAVLSRSAGQDDVIVSVPVAQRNRLETEGLIGFFVNLLSVRIRLDGLGPVTYRALLERVRRAALGAYDHQDLPFDLLVEALKVKRDPSRAPIRQAGFSFLDAGAEAFASLGGLETEPLDVDLGTARLDLTFFMWPAGERLEGRCEYATDLFDASTIRRFLDFYQRVLDDMAGDLTRPVTSLPPLTERAVLSPPIPPEGAVPEAPKGFLDPESNLTENQSLFWFTRKLHEGTELYYDRVVVTFTLSGEIDPTHFRAAFRSLVERSDVLRSRIREVGAMPRRDVLETMEAPVDVVDLAGSDTSFEEWMAERRAAPPPPEERLFDCVLVRLGASKWVWYLSLYHIVTDAWTFDLLFRRMAEGYRLSLEGRLGEAPELPPYQDYVDFERELRDSPRYGRARDYWHKKLERPLVQNTFYQHGGEPTTETVRLSVDLGSERSGRIVAASKDLGIFSPVVFFATALLTYLHRLSGESFLRLGVPFAQRPARFRETIGLFMHVCPIEVEIADGESFASLARKVQVETTATTRHELYPVRNPETHPAYDVHLNYQTMSYREFAGVPVEFRLHSTGRSNDRLNLQVRDFAGSGCFGLDFDFNRAAFGEGDRERSTRHLVRLIDAFLDDAGQGLGHAAMLTEEEREELLGLAERPRVVPEPVTGDRLYVLDRWRGLLPRGIPGELWSGGAGATDPLGDGARLERTGERAVWLADGRLEVLRAAEEREPEAEAGGFVAPRTPVEALLAGIAAEVLGTEQVSVHDDFFTLGGNSLLATQVALKIEEILPVELPLRNVFEAPTVARLAAVIEGMRLALEEEDRELMDEILAELETLLGEEAQGGDVLVMAN